MRLNPSWEGPNAPSINGENIYAGTGIGPNMLPEAEQETQYSYGDYEDQQTYRDQSRGQAASYASARSSSSSYSGSSRSSGYSSIGRFFIKKRDRLIDNIFFADTFENHI